MTDGPRSLLSSVVEDDGLVQRRAASQIAYQTRSSVVTAPNISGVSAVPVVAIPTGTGSVATDREVIEFARNHLRTVFERQPELLDPFYMEPERRKEMVISVLRQARVQHLQFGGVLQHIDDDPATYVQLFYETWGWGPIQIYLDDGRVQEIKINGPRVFVQEEGHDFVLVEERFGSNEDVESRVLNLADMMGVALNHTEMQTTIPVSSGTRVHATIGPMVGGIPLVCMRRARKEAWDLGDVLLKRSLNEDVVQVLQLLANAHCSFLIAGSTGSGKTGLLEALANSWPGEPHILTIEDQVQEIAIRNASHWTKEIINTSKNGDAYNNAAREALRQTPGLLLPGELRGSAASPILWMAMTGHPVLTTLHADSTRDAVLRFAAFASETGAPNYGDRYQDALRDTTQAFQVVIYQKKMLDIGRRVVYEIALTNGIESAGDGTYIPRMIPLVKLDMRSNGEISWHLLARVAADGMLEWHNNETRTPERLAEKLREARTLSSLRVVGTSLAEVRKAAAEAERFLTASEPERALARVSVVWAKRRDTSLLQIAQRAIDRDPVAFAPITRRARHERPRLQQLLDGRQWAHAKKLVAELTSDISLAAACAPGEGWPAIETRIEAGLANEQTARQACAEAQAALRISDPRLAMDKLRQVEIELLPLPLALTVLQAREDAMHALYQRGDGSQQALTTIRQKRQALEAAIAEEQRDATAPIDPAPAESTQRSTL